MTKPTPMGHFPSTDAARTIALQIWDEYRDGNPITGADAIALAEILDRHPDKAEEIGPGIRHFCVGPTYQNRHCFVIVRVDGSLGWFLLETALTGRHPSEERQIVEALREVIPDGCPYMQALAFMDLESVADFRLTKPVHGPTRIRDNELVRRWIAYDQACRVPVKPRQKQGRWSVLISSLRALFRTRSKIVIARLQAGLRQETRLHGNGRRS